MAQLSDMPNEITTMIISLLLPDDIDSFTLTCKKNYDVATTNLQYHWDLKRKYATYRCDTAPEPPFSPVQLLEKILQEPRTASYVREISISGWYSCWTGSWFSGWAGSPLDLELSQGRSHQPCNEGMTSGLKDAVTKLAPSTSEASKWLERLRLGDEGPIVSMLLLLLPNLSALKVESPDLDRVWIEDTLYHIATAKGPGAPLSRLRHARMPGVKLLGLVAALPSIRSLHGSGIKVAHTETWPDDMLSSTSNVRDLTFSECAINAKRLFVILGAFKSLRSYTYDSDPSYDKYGNDAEVKFDPYWMICALSAYARSTLESLTLLSHDSDRQYMGDIRGFEALRHLHTESQMLTSSVENRRNLKCLVRALPPKLETLKLECSGTGDEIGIAKSISSLAELKTEHAPSLRRVEVLTRNGISDFNTTIDDPVRAERAPCSLAVRGNFTYEGILGACNSAGIDLVVQTFDPEAVRRYHL